MPTYLPEDQIVLDGHAFSGEGIAGNELEYRGCVQVWNPADSGENYYVDALALAHANTGRRGADIRACSLIYDAPYGGLVMKVHNKKIGAPDGKLEIRAGYMPASQINQILGVPPLGTLHEVWLGENNQDRWYPFKPAILLAPGTGIAAITSDENQHMILSVQARGYPIV